MEVKKTKKASLKGNNMLYFLGGLNVVLLIIWGLFGYKQVDENVVIEEEPLEIVETTEAILIEIPEPETPPPPPPPSNEPPPPPPPEIPTIIEETPEKVEVPDIAPQEKKIPQIQTSPASTGPIKKVDLSGLKAKTDEAPKEERVNEPVTINRVAEMAVYPGCEKAKGKNELKKCFGEKLGKDVLRYLDVEFPDTDKPVVKVQLEFIVNTEGYIEKIVPKRGDDIFKPESKRAMEKAADYLRRKGKKIKPAKMADGTAAPLIFHQVVALQNPDA